MTMIKSSSNFDLCAGVSKPTPFHVQSNGNVTSGTEDHWVREDGHLGNTVPCTFNTV